MNRRPSWLLVAPGLGLLLAGTPGVAQDRAPINRPSSQSGSAVLGRTGGHFTRQWSSVLNTTPGMTTQQAMLNGGNLNQQNFFGAARGLGGVGSAPLPQAFAFGRVGFSSQMYNYPIDPHVAPPGSAALAAFSGLSVSAAGASGIGWALSNSMPLLGIGTPHVDIAPGPYFAPQPQGTAFDRFFELTPEPKRRPAALGDGESPTVPELIERNNDLYLMKLRQRALAEFAKATSTDVDDRFEALNQACDSLRNVQLLDNSDYVPSLLLLHIALFKNQSMLAANCLDQVLRREPNFFIRRPDVAKYFGDYQSPASQPHQEGDSESWGTSALLADQARYMLRLGDAIPGDSGAIALQVYCAWVLDDGRRVQAIMARMKPEEADKRERGPMERLDFAMAAALRK